MENKGAIGKEKEIIKIKKDLFGASGAQLEVLGHISLELALEKDNIYEPIYPQQIPVREGKKDIS